MTDSQKSFERLNTLISMNDSRLLELNDYQSLIDSEDNEEVYRILRDTVYHFSQEDLLDPQIIEERLMRRLKNAYDFAYKETPERIVINILGIKYLFQNLKVLLKEKATGMDLGHLLIDFGPYPLADLIHLTQTFESNTVYQPTVEMIKETWQLFLDTNNTEAIDVGIDMTYFDQLSDIRDLLDHPSLKAIITAQIDFYNITTALRGLRQNKPNSFMHEMLNDKGTLSIDEFVQIAKSGDLSIWFNQINQLSLTKKFDDIIDKMKNKTYTISEIENLKETYVVAILEEDRLEIDGPVPIIRYLYAVEMEVKNLRLILMGRINELSKEQIKERVRPIYGEGI